MTVWLVTRHPGAVEWVERQGVPFDRHVPHLDPLVVSGGDTLIGTLSIPLAAQMSARGVRYLHIDVAVPPQLRGCELQADQLVALGAHLREYRVSQIGE